MPKASRRLDFSMVVSSARPFADLTQARLIQETVPLGARSASVSDRKSPPGMAGVFELVNHGQGEVLERNAA